MYNVYWGRRDGCDGAGAGDGTGGAAAGDGDPGDDDQYWGRAPASSTTGSTIRHTTIRYTEPYRILRLCLPENKQIIEEIANCHLHNAIVD